MHGTRCGVGQPRVCCAHGACGAKIVTYSKPSQKPPGVGGFGRSYLRLRGSSKKLLGNPHTWRPPPRSAPKYEVGAERSSDGEVARTPELRRPGRARPWSAARARALALLHPPSPSSRGSLLYASTALAETREHARVPPSCRYHGSPQHVNP